MVNEKDFKNAVRVITMFQEYTIAKLGNSHLNSDFPSEHELLFLGEERHPSRGRGNVYLTINGGKLSTFVAYADGSTWNHDIVTHTIYRYAYNSTEQKTIDLAVALAENKRLIKEGIDKMLKEYELNRNTTSWLLENFSIND